MPSPPPPAADLETVEVRTPDGRSVRLADVWRDRPVVLALIRHFG